MELQLVQAPQHQRTEGPPSESGSQNEKPEKSEAGGEVDIARDRGIFRALSILDSPGTLPEEKG